MKIYDLIPTDGRGACKNVGRMERNNGAAYRRILRNG